MIRKELIMRNTMLLVAASLMIAGTAQAQDSSDPNWPWAQCVAQGKGRACDGLYKPRETTRTNTDRDSPEYKDYEFRAWEIDQENKREIEAINRDYNLRRSGLLP